MQLPPEVTRLRYIAKACAAGELSRVEYRQARRRAIEGFVEQTGAGDEDTVPRYDPEVTQRRYAGQPEPEPVQALERQSWPLRALLTALLAILLVLPLWSIAANDMESLHAPVIGPVNQRDPNPATSPRFRVDTLLWVAMEEVDAGMVAAANTFLASQLDGVKQSNAPQDHGFSSNELEQIGHFLNAVGVHEEGNRLTRDDFDDLRALIRAQKENRGVSLIQLEKIAAALQSWVHDQGFPLARVYLPVQKVRDGVIRVEVQRGILSGIRVAQADHADGSVFKDRLADLLGRPVRRNAVETKLNSLNRTRGLHAEAHFSPGSELGETEMVLRVKQQQRFMGGVELDNYGVEELGEERVGFNAQWLNPRGVGDVLSAKGFTTIGPADHLYGRIGYLTPVLNGHFDASTQITFADLSLAGSTPLEGDGVLLDGRLTDTQLFTRTRRREVFYRAGVHDLDWDAVPGQRNWYAGVGIEGHRLWDGRKVAVSGSLEGLVGGLDETRPGQDSTFWRVRGGLNAWTPVTLPWLDVRAALVLDMQWQLATDMLPATLRMGATGPYANKGFAQADTLLDQGIGLQSAIRFDAPVGQWWLFVDTTYGVREGIREQWRALSSAGLGWEGQLLHTAVGRLSSRITLGHPVSHKGTGGVEDDGMQIYWAVRFEH